MNRSTRTWRIPVPSRRTLLAGAAGLLAVPFLVGTASAQDKDNPYPWCDTIEVISHASPGGGTDTTARMMMIRSRRHLKTDLVVVYKRGGGARKAHEYFKSKPADGCTVIALTQTHLYTIARGNSPITIDDIVGVGRAMDDPTFIVVNKDSPIKSIKSLISESKGAPLNWGVAQIGSTEHIGLMRFAKAAGEFKYKVVPFGSGGPMVSALMAGAIEATLPNVSEAKPQIEEGTFRALVVLNDKRLKGFPNVPSSFENGWKIKVTTTRGYGVKKGTPMERIEALEKAMTKAMTEEPFAGYLRNAGLDPAESVAGHAVWDAQLKDEYAVAEEAVKSLGIGK